VYRLAHAVTFALDGAHLAVGLTSVCQGMRLTRALGAMPRWFAQQFVTVQ
jgi:hypothetical protein